MPQPRLLPVFDPLLLLETARKLGGKAMNHPCTYCKKSRTCGATCPTYRFYLANKAGDRLKEVQDVHRTQEGR